MVLPGAGWQMAKAKSIKDPGPQENFRYLACLRKEMHSIAFNRVIRNCLLFPAPAPSKAEVTEPVTFGQRHIPHTRQGKV